MLSFQRASAAKCPARTTLSLIKKYIYNWVNEMNWLMFTSLCSAAPTEVVNVDAHKSRALLMGPQTQHKCAFIVL